MPCDANLPNLPVPLSSSSSYSTKERVVQGHSTSPQHLTSPYVAKLYAPLGPSTTPSVACPWSCTAFTIPCEDTKSSLICPLWNEDFVKWSMKTKVKWVQRIRITVGCYHMSNVVASPGESFEKCNTFLDFLSNLGEQVLLLQYLKMLRLESM